MSFISTRTLSTKINVKLKWGEKLLANVLNQMDFAIFGSLKHLHYLIHGLVKSRGESEKYFAKNAVRKNISYFWPFIHKYFIYKNSCFMWSVWCILVKKPHTFYSKDAKFNDGNSIPLELGERIRLRCNFKGNPPPKVVWYKNEKLINPEEDIGVNGQMWKLKIINKR